MPESDPWPLILFGLRIATVGLLYLFLLAAFRALRADLRASSAPERARTPARTPARAEAVMARPGLPARAEAYPTGAPGTQEWDDEGWDDETWDEDVLAPAGDGRGASRSGVRPRVWLPVTAAILVAAFGGTALLLAEQEPGEPTTNVVGAEATAVDPLEPPTIPPDPGRVTVGLATTQDAQVRVTVDGVVEFDGTLRRGQRQEWEGAERIQVWTDSGKSVQLAVNGEDLGAYSPAMGHPDWNRIDYGFWPGWAQ